MNWTRLAALVTAGFLGCAGPARATLVQIQPSQFQQTGLTITFDDTSLSPATNPSYVVAPNETVAFGPYFNGQALTMGDNFLSYLTVTTPAGRPVLTSNTDASTQITPDVSTPPSSNMVLVGVTDFFYLGPVSIAFSTPVAAVAFTGASFVGPNAMTIEAYDVAGTSVGTLDNTSAGSQRFYLADDGGTAIAGLSLYIPADVVAGFSIDDVAVSLGGGDTTPPGGGGGGGGSGGGSGQPVPEPMTACALGLVALGLARAGRLLRPERGIK